jgi:ATP-dependent helicase/nuclease subunit A
MTLLTPQQSKALDYKKHISLTANAGSGKTFVLSKRFLEIAINENLPLRNIAAITFTDKAAGELYQKIAKEIDIRIRETEDKSLIERLELIRRQLVSANISTIHSFCIDVLREHPVEADIDANFTPIDEIYADELIELSVEEVIRLSLENPADEEKLKYLIRLFSSKILLSNELKQSIKHRRNLLNLSENLYNLPVEDIAYHFHQAFLSATNKIFTEHLPRLIEKVLKINSIVLSSSPKNQIAIEIKQILSKLTIEKNFVNILLLLGNLRGKILTKGGTVAIRGYLNREDSIAVSYECSFVEELLDKWEHLKIPDNHSEIEIELAKFGKTFIYFFEKTHHLYSEKKREGGYLDYEDILLFTQNILKNEDMKKSLSEKFKYIMIDEYQDTNELQYNIFLPILDYLRTGNLFVVGDEKQSIYMFRDAELEIFNKTKKEISKISGTESMLYLPDSFRMAPNLCLFINVLFKNLFHDPKPLFNEVEHSEIICAREDSVKGNIEILLAESNEKEEAEIAEANLVSDRILKLINDSSNQKKQNWGDIAILCRKRKSFIELEKAFIRRRIPYSIIGGKGFYQRQSIYDIFNYFSFLLNQNDDTALVGILRSPFFSVSDSEIFEISSEKESSYWLKLKSYSSKNSKIFHIVKNLEDNISLVSKTEISFILRKIISETGYISLVSSKANSTQEQANINKLINLTIDFFAEGFKTLYDYVNFLREAIEQVEDESQAVISDELNSVKIMTIHQAKGLEFPNVFLYRCGESTRMVRVKSKSLSINKEFGILTRIPLYENYFSDYFAAPIVSLTNYIGERKNLAEIKRLFYVAITRAKNQIFISASSDSTFSAKSDSFIHLLSEGLNIDFNSPQFALNSKLKMLIKKDNTYDISEKEMQIEIPIIRRLESTVTPDTIIQQFSRKNFQLTKSIDDKAFGEIISATKLGVYNQCPLKYHLIYVLGFSNLMIENRSWLNNYKMTDTSGTFDFNPKEETQLAGSMESEISKTELNYAKIKGTLIHRLLKEEITEAELESKTEYYLKDMFDESDWQTHDFQNLKQDVITDLINYFGSQNYIFFKEYSDYRNEYEIYHQHEDYYLYGIIDKLIINKNNIIIIDYKTDAIPVDAINQRADQYFTQLKFYAYIVNKFFRGIDNLELRVVFLKYPNELIAMNVEEKDLGKIEQNIELMVKKSRKQILKKNLEHCKFCIFSINNKCIIT